jgi:hypothetical protein
MLQHHRVDLGVEYLHHYHTWSTHWHIISISTLDEHLIFYEIIPSTAGLRLTKRRKTLSWMSLWSRFVHVRVARSSHP